ncbi:S-adenosyl-L-methionine-dependent methyltransferase [Aspergillus egyptiacus]|nr:S-adenosyl-L-methionine-dependent methyltransferase [Aspergillus egyptiacus]
MSTQILSTDLYLGQARASFSVQHCMAIYDKWAATYNHEVGNEAQNYVAPVLVAQAALASAEDPAKCVILDAGCGTGLVGQALALAGAKVIDGLDLSPAMLKVAKQTGVYRNLAQADLTRRIDTADETYDMVTCVGTFTLGHVGPRPALSEFVRITRRHGIVAASILEEIWVSGGFKAEVERLEAEGRVTVVTQELIDYVKGHGDRAVLVILQKLNSA